MVRVSLIREMDVNDDEYRFLLQAEHEGDGQMFEEITQLSWEGTIKVELLETKDE